jgi:hypothetical protein
MILLPLLLKSLLVHTFLPQGPAASLSKPYHRPTLLLISSGFNLGPTGMKNMDWKMNARAQKKEVSSTSFTMICFPKMLTLPF